MSGLEKLAGLSRYTSYIAPVFVVFLVSAFFLKVDLEPKITPDFFFSSDSEIFKKNQKIADVFPSQQQLLLNVTTSGNIEDPAFLSKIETLTARIQTLEGVSGVQSLTSGPPDLEAARENPLWRRLLIGNEEESSFILVFVNTEEFAPLIENLEQITKEEQSDLYQIRLSGLPYIVEQIRRNLTQDMKTFTLGAIVLSALVLFAVFRSGLIVVGALISCISAAMFTLIIQSFMGIPIGILTANLGTIVFVLTLSHVIFLTSNWCNAARQSEDVKLRETVSNTLPASFWAGVTTLLGFVSLIFVEAKPLNQLGVGGTVGTAAALICAYTIFPAFLKLATVKPSEITYVFARKFPQNKKVTRPLSWGIVGLAIVLGVSGTALLKTDPSLLSYFNEGSELHDGLYYVDKNGGSSPLLYVVRRDDAVKLDNDDSYERMWQLQQQLADHEAVGSVISLPIIMAEGDSHWLGQFLPWNMLLDILSKPEFGAIASSFVTPDRVHALYMLRMKETGREQDRLTVMQSIEQIPENNGFEITAKGGTYYLQGELAASVARSMMTGVLSLIVIFGIVGYLASGSFLVSVGVMISAATVSALVIGTLGVLGVPVDVISSPAINICLGLAVDNMIHVTTSAKRHLKAGKFKSLSQFSVWKAALDTQSWPAIISTLTIMIGFSVFALSDFPPSQRFGLEIAFGAGLAVIIALVVFPYIVGQKENTE